MKKIFLLVLLSLLIPNVAWSQINPGGGGGGGSVTWPTSGDVVISNSSSSPTGVAPVNGDCLVGSGGTWTAGSCSSGGGSTFIQSAYSTTNFGGLQ